MDRRIALKNMGLALGYTVATPTLLNLMQSCQQDTGPDWTPLFFSLEQGVIVMQLADLILPKTDTPSATEIGVHKFLDRYISEVSEIKDQELFQKGLIAFIGKALSDSGKDSPADLTTEDLEPVLAATLAKREGEEEAKIYASLGAYNQAMAAGEQADLDAGVLRYVFANQFRDAIIWSYKTSEYIGEEVLAYLPVPGEYIGCGDLDELTGGKAWSL